MNEVGEAIAHTPLWVWPVLGLVVLLGARNLWTRERRIAVMFILPAIMLIVALTNLATSSADQTLVIPAFIFSFLVGIAIGWSLAPRAVVVNRTSRTVRVPGSVIPLLIVILIVILRYAMGYVYGRWPELRPDPALALEFGATGALLAGIVWGRVLWLGRLYLRNA